MVLYIVQHSLAAINTSSQIDREDHCSSMDLDLGVEIDGRVYDMAVCPKADSPMVTKMLGEKIPLIYRFVEEGSCCVTEAFDQLCGMGVSIPRELAESMQPRGYGAKLQVVIETINKLSTEAIDHINHICCSDFQECYDKVEVIKGKAKIIELLSEDYINKLTHLHSMLENVMDDVRMKLIGLQDVLGGDSALNENFRQAIADYEVYKKDQNSKEQPINQACRDAVIILKRCINMISQSMMGCKVFKEGETSKERRNRENEVGELHQALHYLSEHVNSHNKQEDREIRLRMSILILEAKSLDLQNAIEFLDNLYSLSVFIKMHGDFYTDIPIILRGLCKMSRVEMDSFKSKGIYLNARWVTIQKACADYTGRSILHDSVVDYFRHSVNIMHVDNSNI